MLNKINDKKKIINLKNILEEFLDEYDCKDIKCEVNGEMKNEW